MIRHTKEELMALDVALYDNDWAWLNTQAERAGMTLDAFVGDLLDELYATGSKHPPVDRPAKPNPALTQLVQAVTEVFGDEASLAARARAYDAVTGTPNGPGWCLAFQIAYTTELRRLLTPQ